LQKEDKQQEVKIMNKSQKEFEAWAKDKLCLDKRHDGTYEWQSTLSAWLGWQASRQALVFELPSSLELYNSPANEVLEAVQDAPDAAGVRYK